MLDACAQQHAACGVGRVVTQIERRLRDDTRIGTIAVAVRPHRVEHRTGLGHRAMRAQRDAGGGSPASCRMERREQAAVQHAAARVVAVIGAVVARLVAEPVEPLDLEGGAAHPHIAVHVPAGDGPRVVECGTDHARR